jgi:hypothetical protein
LACKYCPHPKLQRSKEDMTMFNFMRALEWVTYFDQQGTQPELAITGMGEALLHPHFNSLLRTARHSYKGFLHFSTNGILFNEEIADLCEELNVKVFISAHRPELAGPAVMLAEKRGILAGVNTSFVDSALDFAGTVKWENSAPEQDCMYQRDAWGMVLSDGTINTCCWEPEGKNAIGHIRDNIGSVEMKVMPECANCALIIENPTGVIHAI